LDYSNPPITIAPYLFPTVQGDLLASVSFTVLNPAVNTFTLTIGDVVFYDNSTQRNPIPNIVAGSPITESITAPPTPPPNPTNTFYILAGVAGGIIVAILALFYVRRRRGTLGNASLKKPTSKRSER